MLVYGDYLSKKKNVSLWRVLGLHYISWIVVSLDVKHGFFILFF